MFKQLHMLFVTGSLSSNICWGKQVVLQIRDQSRMWCQSTWTSRHLHHSRIRALSPKSKYSSTIIFFRLQILVVCRGQVMWKTFCYPQVSRQTFRGACAVMIAQKLPKLILFNLGNYGLFFVRPPKSCWCGSPLVTATPDLALARPWKCIGQTLASADTSVLSKMCLWTTFQHIPLFQRCLLCFLSLFASNNVGTFIFQEV